MGSSNGSHLVDPNGDLLKTLENCEGHYTCPRDSDGNLLGPVVGYAAKYQDADGSEKNWVGLEYFNFSQADPWPAVLTAFAYEMRNLLVKRRVSPDIIVGAPWAGVKFSQETASILGCRHIFAEKKGDDIILGRYEGVIRRGDSVVIGEELVNNASTTKKLIDLIENAGGRVIAIACAINRSYPFRDSFAIASDREPIPIIGVIERSTPQYRQDDTVVAEAIASGDVIWKPKYAWDKMKAAMDAYPR